MPTSDLHEPTYLGDGVYAGHDGYQIWLKTQEGMAIALEDKVVMALTIYAVRIGLITKEEINAKTTL
jgi:hypothetical protein